MEFVYNPPVANVSIFQRTSMCISSILNEMRFVHFMCVVAGTYVCTNEYSIEVVNIYVFGIVCGRVRV